MGRDYNRNPSRFDMLPISSIPSSFENANRRVEAPEVEYLLVCQAQSQSFHDGSWSFSLETASGDSVLEAEDVETGDLNRLTLLAAVRGLESIDGPASVLLLSNNRYLIRSLSESLPRWRASGFEWEHFGRRIEVQHADLWRRVDRALEIHCVQACLISSRLVSGGLNRSEKQEQQSFDQPFSRSTNRDAFAGGSSWDRFDNAHSEAAKPRGLSSDRDGLRRWLLGDVAKRAAPAVQNRFKPEDLL